MSLTDEEHALENKNDISKLSNSVETPEGHIDDPESVKPKKTQKPQNMLDLGVKYFKERRKVFLALDLEQWEHNMRCLTEIGIAIYDSSQYPADSPSPFYPLIKCSHYIVEENKHRVNGTYVPDNMHNFSFGKSLLLSLNDCRKVVNSVFSELSATGRLVIVGHGVAGDINVLRRQGFSLPQKLEILDTSKIWRITRPYGFGSLDKVLEFFEIPHGLMHNAGNDAYLNLILYFVLCDPVVRKQKGIEKVMEEPTTPVQGTGRRQKGRISKLELKLSTANEAIQKLLG